jgi:hypothetical protein
VLTDSTGQVEIDVPRDRAGTFEPQIVKKRQRRLNGVDEILLSLYAKGRGWSPPPRSCPAYGSRSGRPTATDPVQLL